MIEQMVALVRVNGDITATPPEKAGSGKVTDADLEKLLGSGAKMESMQSVDKEVMSPTGLPFTARILYTEGAEEKNAVASEFIGEEIMGDAVVCEVRLGSTRALNAPRYERLQSIAARHKKAGS